MWLDAKTFFNVWMESVIIYWPWILFAVVLLILGYFLRLRRLRLKPIRASGSELGELFVTQKALLKLIASTVVEFEALRIEKIKLLDKKHALRVRLYIKLQPEIMFDQISMQLQEKIKQIFSKYLGIAKAVHVDVILAGILQEASRVPVNGQRDSFEN
ncbi:MAG: hypothetical protein LBE99_04770 [Puniceicoccales bacterium]|jgi:hypothetical protein|nr:hypothetical protein [Puniceicoccales bacterium]